jgi:flagellar protein FlgJ
MRMQALPGPYSDLHRRQSPPGRLPQRPAEGRKAAGAKDQEQRQAELKRACQMFEAQFLKMLWKEMRRTVDKSGLLHGGLAEELWTDMLDQAVSDASARRESLGVARLLYQQLSRQAQGRPGVKIGQPLTGGAPYDLDLRFPARPLAGRRGVGPAVMSPAQGE